MVRTSLFNDLFFNWPEAPKPPMVVEKVRNHKDKDPTGWYTEGYRITMALAGFTEKDVEVSVDGQIMHIKGSNTSDEILPAKFQCTFNHSLQISKELDLNKTKVTLENGLLRIFIPIAEEKKTKRRLLFGKRE